MNPFQTANRLQFFQPSNPAGLETNSPIMATNSPQNSSTIQGVLNGQQMAVPPDDIWMEFKTTEGKPYYYNKITKQASWTKGPSTTFSASTASLTNSPNVNGQMVGGVSITPGGNVVQQGIIFPGQPEVPGSVPLWRELRTADGKYYYYNSITKVSQWTKPEGFISTGPTISLGSVSLPSSSNTSTKSTVGQVNNKNGTSSLLEQCMEKTLQNLGKPSMEERNITPSSPAKSENVKNLAAEKFKEFIKEKYEHGRFKLDDNWNKVIRHLQTDCRWSIIAKVSEKKHIFNIWRDQKAKEERENKRLGLRKNKDNLEKWLLDNPLLKPYMSFSKAEKVFASEPAWKAVTDVQDRKDIFRNAQDLMRNTFKKREEEQSRKNKDALLNVLADIPEVTYRTTWKEAQYYLSIDPTFKKNKNLLKMNKIDALEAFQDHIYNLEDEHEKEESRKNKELKREERKVRDRYRALLDKLAGEGLITSLTYWSEVFATISKHSCFEEMLKQTKISPLDMFKCYVSELKESYDKDKSIIKRILEKCNFTIEIDTDFETIKDLVVADEKGQKTNLSNVKMFFTSQKLRAEKRKQHAMKKEEKRLRKLENAFHRMLSSTVGEIDDKVVYEDVVDKISNEEIFNEVESDEQRKQFFDSYLVKLTTSCGHNHSKQKESKKIKNKKLLKYQQLTDTDDSDGDEKKTTSERKRPFQNGSPISSDDDEDEPIPEKKEKLEVTDEDLSEGEIRD